MITMKTDVLFCRPTEIFRLGVSGLGLGLRVLLRLRGAWGLGFRIWSVAVVGLALGTVRLLQHVKEM